jgi:adenine-specific DNA methylase
MPSDTRLIERWMPIAALGEESVRERRSMTALPPTYYLHVWWARRPLVASRAAILASLLPADADRKHFFHALGIHGDPVKAKKRIELADRRGERLGAEAYGYRRAFTHAIDESDARWMSEVQSDGAVVLDPTAGGGSIPFECVRLGYGTVANDLNPVAALLLKATVQYPAIYGASLVSEFTKLSVEYVAAVKGRLSNAFPLEESADVRPDGYLYARTITCPYCEGIVPLSPNWKLSGDGRGVRLRPQTTGKRVCSFEVVDKSSLQSEATVSDGDALCPFPDCKRVIDGDAHVKRQAQAGQMGDQLYTVVIKRKKISGYTKTGKEKVKWEREFRSPRSTDDNSAYIAQFLSEKLPEWETLDLIPNEPYNEMYCDRSRIYGVRTWRDLFSPRQLLCHGMASEVYREMLERDQRAGEFSSTRQAAYIYLALSLDKLRDYNSRMTRWHSNREVVAGTFDRHDFSFKWSYVEMAPLVDGLGFDWVTEQTEKCIRELCGLLRPEDPIGKNAPTLAGLAQAPHLKAPEVGITCKPADMLDQLQDGCVDIVVMDPPYYDNVMYAELSDFFYVWLKRTAGHVVPELFRMSLTDKENEAVANPSRFRGQSGAAALANKDYRHKMASIFAECHRVLKPNGIMTLMFTHKATGAWDALTKGLMQAAFTITASWPINTEAEGSLHIKDKAAANSTIFLVCRPRADRGADGVASYWEDVEPQVAGAVRERIKEFQDAGIGGVDLYLACFGPALQKFSEHWPLRRGTPRSHPEARKRRKQAEMFEEPWDPYEVTPEDALDAARREVKHWRLQQLTHMKARTDLDPLTSFYVLAWDAFRAPKFDYDEALRLARAVGVDLEKDIIGHVAEKKTSFVILWDSAKRAAKGAIGPADGSRSWLDVVHHAAYGARSHNLQYARELLNRAQVDGDPAFFAALEAVLEVLPVSKTFSGIDLEGDVAEFGSDFEALENMRKLAFASDVDEPQQLQLWKEEAEAAANLQGAIALSDQTDTAHSEEG